ncbi:hypothetical protein T440DRAFT_480696 [Plenodomus tracheiphilus IPT5]|uniref:Uncharacterized protein n=1 Tax=Plenodomus tracheiphilus IPT5 TaxID=1408161 RepID=A0A6A7B1T3_9PLEO|nr:hypothetical protein T440DRAFT_480696 [Plenodomus tracheiphilus IPT5]
MSTPPPPLTPSADALQPLTPSLFPPFAPLTPLPSATPATPSPLPVDFLELLENWQIPHLNISAILPASLCPPIQNNSSNTATTSLNTPQTTLSHLQTPTQKTTTQTFPWTTPLLNAILTLSKITVGQRDRAHSLLLTYFNARIRESSYRGNAAGIYAALDVCDVEKAIESVRRMSRGREMEGDSTSGKRKYSIRDERFGVGMERVKEQSRKLVKVVEEEDGEVEKGLLSPPRELVGKDGVQETDRARHSTSLSPSPFRNPLFTPQTKRIIHLPPIQTSNISTPTVPVIALANTNPNSKSNPKTNTHTTHPTLHPNTNTMPIQPTHPFPPPFLNNPYNTPTQSHTTSPIISAQHGALEAAQHATHEFNVRRRELAHVERVYEGARVRFLEAGRRMDRAERRARGRGWEW